jgi:hypothetical protein
MRRWPGLVLVLLTGWFAGCVTSQPEQSTSLMERPRPFQGPTGPDVVQLDIALLERPVGDPYLNRGVWDFADEQGIAAELRAVLEDNGLRVGQVGGIPPTELQALLTSDRCNVNPRKVLLHADSPTTVVLGPPRLLCQFDLQHDSRAMPVKLAQAQFTLAVVPKLTPDGRTCLRFTPQIQHGEMAPAIELANDRSGFFLRGKQATESYPRLCWEVTVAPNEYVLVGTCFERPATLGHQMFVRPDEPKPVQRLLAIRTGRLAKEMAAPFDDDNAITAGRSLPLAFQTQVSAACGNAQK